MAKDVSQSVRDSLSAAATNVAQAMTAPDAAPMMPILMKLHQDMVGMIQRGMQGPGQGMQQQGMPGQGPPPGQQGPPPGGPGGPPQGPPQGPPGGQQMPQAGGRGLFPNSPVPSAQQLQELIGSRTGM
jgi:hypothetical protein